MTDTKELTCPSICFLFMNKVLLFLSSLILGTGTYNKKAFWMYLCTFLTKAFFQNQSQLFETVALIRNKCFCFHIRETSLSAICSQTKFFFTLFSNHKNILVNVQNILCGCFPAHQSHQTIHQINHSVGIIYLWHPAKQIFSRLPDEIPFM